MNLDKYSNLIITGGRLELSDEALAFISSKLKTKTMHEILSDSINYYTSQQEVKLQTETLVEIQKTIEELVAKGVTISQQSTVPSSSMTSNEFTAQNQITATAEEKIKEEPPKPKPKLKLDMGNVGKAINKMNILTGGD